jgi:hypothetical protein
MGSDAPQKTVSMVVATPKPLVVKLVISKLGEDNYSLVGSTRKAIHYEIKIELGGLAGVVAPLIGKEPPDIQMWAVTAPTSDLRQRTRPHLSRRPHDDHPTRQPRLARLSQIRRLD